MKLKSIIKNDRSKWRDAIAVSIFFVILIIPFFLDGYATAQNVPVTGNDTNKEIDKSTIPRLRWVGPGKPGTYEDYLKYSGFGKTPFRLERTVVPGEGAANQGQKVLILVNTSVYTNLQSEISRYANSLISAGYTIELYQSSGGTAEQLKTFIKTRESDLIGCVFIGSLPAAWYEVTDDYYSYGYAQFPCDLFLMDLDGNWVDSDANGKYDTHTDGSGDQSPEIFIGRIDASLMDGDEYDLLRDFFDKDNEYWNGNMTLLKYGLTYTEDDWAGYSYFLHDISYLYSSDYEAIAAPNTNRDDYLDNRLKANTYEFIQLSCHSASGGHFFTRGGWLYSSGVRSAPPQGLGFNLFCCSALRFTNSNHLGGAYVFNAGQKALTVTGSTKTGSMLQFSYFYNPLGDNKPMGVALKEWFEQVAPYDIWDVFWHYGMTIIGDPMIMFLNQPQVSSPDIYIYHGNDFTGNNKADITVYRPSNGYWYVKGGAYVCWGIQAGDIPVPGDYNGDGTTDIAVYRNSNGYWYIRGVGNYKWGIQSGDIPVPGDYNKDGKTDIAVYRPSNGYWYIKEVGNYQWGIQSGDIPVPGDYNGDNQTDIAVYRPSNGYWYIKGIGNYRWGIQSGDIPVPGDYNGNGTTDIAIYRHSNGYWYVRGGTSVRWGIQSEDIPVQADYDGDGDYEIAVFRPSNGTWYIRGFGNYVWGIKAGDIPVTRGGK